MRLRTLFLLLALSACASPTTLQPLRDLRTAATRPDIVGVTAGSWVLGRWLDRTGANACVQERLGGHDRLDAGVSDALAIYGEGATLLLLASALYGVGAQTGTEHHRRAAVDAMRCLGVVGLATAVLKVAVHQRRPNGGAWGWPSGHSAATMAFAASLDESYGHRVGVPLVLLSLATAAQRLDSGMHDLDDVVAGLALGWCVGRAFTAPGRTVAGAAVSPWAGAGSNAALGLQLHWSF